MTLAKDFSSETIWQILIKFHMQTPGKGGKKVYIFSPGHVTKIATMPIDGKAFKNLFLQNYWADCLETCCVAFGDLVLQRILGRPCPFLARSDLVP